MHSAHRAIRSTLVAALLLMCVVPLGACFGVPNPPQVAATVNGDVIVENEVTDFIEAFRRKNVQFETDTSWADFLISNGYTSESLRTYVLENVFIPKLLIQQQCDERGIHVGDTELDNVIEREKEFYEDRYGENSWNSVLASYGYDEQSWRENELDRLLEEELSNEVFGEVVPTQAEIQATADKVASTYNGKKSYYIEFASEQDAQAAHARVVISNDRINLDQFNRLGSVVSAGWNSLPSARNDMSPEYVQASNSLELNQVSEPVEVDGTWMLVYCDEIFNVDEKGGDVVLQSIPAEIYDQIVADATLEKSTQLMDSWLKELAQSSDIVIEPMPSGLSYNVSTTYVEE